MEKPKRNSKETIMKKRIVIAVIIGVFIAITIGVYARESEGGTIQLTVNDAEIVQGEALPEFTTTLSFEGNEKHVLDQKEYRIEDLIQSLEKQKGFDIVLEGDGELEGSYEIHLQLDKSLEDKILKEWDESLSVKLYSGTLLVKNPFGQWKEDVFYDWNDEVRINQWIQVEGKEYYLNESGEKTTGELILGNVRYTFSETGEVSSKDKWVDPEKPMVAITLDDGPDQYLNAILDILEATNSRATFYWQGVRIAEEDRAAMVRTIEQGSEIGNHSMYHPNFNKISTEEIRYEVDAANQLIQQYAGVIPTTIRPPYGASDGRVTAVVGMPVVLWCVDPKDWSNKSKEETLIGMTTNIKDGDIILAHETNAWTVEAMAEAIPILQQQGFQVITVSEMAAAKGVSLDPGEKFFSM